MSLLQYTSKEMFSSTELIRKSKKVFDKVHNEEIEKAVILRDGKPSFILLDFDKYEDLVNRYLELKEGINKQKSPIKNTEKKEIPKPNTHNDKIEEKETSEINSDELQEALAQIEKLELNIEPKQTINKKEGLKEFWD